MSFICWRPGRTSVLVNEVFDRAFYGLAGFRILGRRAVRVDILERLADLIRPALSWKPGTGLRPDGGYDGSAFLVTPAMMSILGATGEDIEEILKGLGYRAEPKPAADVKTRLETLDTAAREAIAKAAADRAAAQAEAAAASTAEIAATGDGIDGSVAAAAPSGEEVSSTEAIEPVPLEAGGQAADVGGVTEDSTFAQTVEAVEPVVDAAPSAAPIEEAETVAAPAAETVAAPERVAVETEAVAPVQAEADAGAPVQLERAAEGGADGEAQVASEPAISTEEPKPILLWRPGRFEQRPKNRHGDRNRNQRGGPPRQDSQRLEGQQEGPPDVRGPRRDRPEGAQAAPEQQRHGKPKFDRSRYKGKPDGNRPGGDNGNRQDHGERRKDGGKPTFQSKPREERPVRFDPDSPFAKLAALRDQLKK